MKIAIYSREETSKNIDEFGYFDVSVHIDDTKKLRWATVALDDTLVIYCFDQTNLDDSIMINLSRGYETSAKFLISACDVSTAKDENMNKGYTVGYRVKNVLHDGKYYSPDDVNFERPYIPGRTFVVYGKINDTLFGRMKTALSVKVCMYRFYLSFARSALYSFYHALRRKL